MTARRRSKMIRLPAPGCTTLARLAAALTLLAVAPRVGAAATPDDTAHAADSGSLPARRPPSPGVFVTLESDEPAVRLERIEATGGDPQPKCGPPCRRWLERDALYRVAGDGVRASPPFALSPTGSDVRISVKAGSSAGFAAGLGAVTVGGAAALTGTVLLLSGLGGLEAMTDDQRTTIARSQRTGWVITLSGAAVVGLRIFLLRRSRTRVTVDAH